MLARHMSGFLAPKTRRTVRNLEHLSLFNGMPPGSFATVSPSQTICLISSAIR